MNWTAAWLVPLLWNWLCASGRKGTTSSHRQAHSPRRQQTRQLQHKHAHHRPHCGLWISHTYKDSLYTISICEDYCLDCISSGTLQTAYSLVSDIVDGSVYTAYITHTHNTCIYRNIYTSCFVAELQNTHMFIKSIELTHLNCWFLQVIICMTAWFADTMCYSSWRPAVVIDILVM